MRTLYWILSIVTVVAFSLFAYYTFRHRHKGISSALLDARHEFMNTLMNPVQAWNLLMERRLTELEYQAMSDPSTFIQHQADELKVKP